MNRGESELDAHNKRPIRRRDFLNGIALAVGTSALAVGALPTLAQAARQFPQDLPGYYPPALTGMRGSGPGSFENAHAVRDGNFWPHASSPIATGERYDLVVVGAGLSGLAAAHFYRKHDPKARILILDNHDDFGGHARRDEFTVRGRMLVTNGGTYAIESPFPYSTVARGLLDELGIDPPALAARDDRWNYYKGLSAGFFFDRETFGEERFVAGFPSDFYGDSSDKAKWETFLRKTPLSTRAQADILRVETASVDYLPGLTSDQKKERLSRISYKTFLLELVKIDPSVIPFYASRTFDLWGVQIDAVSALDCWGCGYPGFQGMRLQPGPYHRMGFTAKGTATPNQPAYTFHFPDGNASIARMLVRRLVSGSLTGNAVDDVVTARADYSKLDRGGSPVRIRLSSTVVRVAHRGDPAHASEVDVLYARGSAVYGVQARAVVMAGWNMMIPYVVPGLPSDQQDALHYGVKVPLVYTAVAVRNWHAFHKLGVQSIYTPGMFHAYVRLDNPVNIGAYTSPHTPDQPIVLRMLRTPCKPGLSERDQHRVGRAELLSEPFSTFEREIRSQLATVLGPAGFDEASDIEAITVNRWPHGYAYEYNPLFDPDSFFNGGATPNEVARRRFGRIAIANSDAAAAAYTDQAINQAYRAVEEIMTS
ncbi:MAG: NAD(P)-binding protein [Candidatus Eremiobacteraeota bacterium]|nr:NAD(P)-binding protein [Candidatus Eremiobacteraeota bacterium]